MRAKYMVVVCPLWGAGGGNVTVSGWAPSRDEGEHMLSVLHSKFKIRVGCVFEITGPDEWSIVAIVGPVHRACCPSYSDGYYLPGADAQQYDLLLDELTGRLNAISAGNERSYLDRSQLEEPKS